MFAEVLEVRRARICIKTCIFAATLAALLTIPTAAFADVVYSGRCGETTNWTLDSNNVLTVSGTGSVVKTGYNDGYKAPNNFSVRESGTGSGYLYMQHLATSLVIEEGITSIEDGLFKNYRLLESVTLPSTLTGIGDDTFKECRGITSINIASNSTITSIGANAFNTCRALASFTVPASVKTIGDGAFEDCMALTQVKVEKGSALTSIGNSTFAGCSAIASADFSAATKLKTVGSNIFPKNLLKVKIAKITSGKKKLTVTWNAVPGATRYVVCYKLGSAKKYASVKANSTKTTITKLKKGKAYKLCVTAYMGGKKLCTSKVKTSGKIK